MTTFNVVFLHEDVDNLQVSLPVDDIEAFVELIRKYGMCNIDGVNLKFSSFKFDECGVFYLSLENEE